MFARALLAPAAYRRRLHRFTVDEVKTMRADGRLPAEPAVEIIDGVIYDMPADGFRTIDWNAAIAEALYRQVLGGPLRIVPDKTLILDAFNGPKPDFYIHDRALSAKDVTGANVLLVIEVSDTTLAEDLLVKAPLYARGGVREYWVVDIAAREIVIHRLFGDAYPEPRRAPASEAVAAGLATGLTVRLDDLAVARAAGQ